MQKEAFGPTGSMGPTDYLMSAAPYGMMWYGNMLAAPWPENYATMNEQEKRKVKMRQLLKGAVFGASGYAATRLLFNKDYKKMNQPEGEEEEKMAQALRNVISVKR